MMDTDDTRRPDEGAVSRRSQKLKADSARFLLVGESGQWKPFAKTNLSEDDIYDLIDVMNESLGLIGIAIRHKAPESSTEAIHLEEELAKWEECYASYVEGLYDEITEDYPYRFQANEFLPTAMGSIEIGQSEKATPVIRDSEKQPWYKLEAAPTRFKFGPVIGSQQQLAAAIPTNVRTLKRHNDGWYWIQRVNSNTYRFWCDSEKEFKRIESLLPKERIPKKRASRKS